MKITPIETRVFREGESLTAFVHEHVTALPERSVLAVSSKVVAFSQGRSCRAGSPREKAELIRAESDWAIPTSKTWIAIKEGMLIPSAGIDESNANGKWVLLPRKPYPAAQALRRQLMTDYKVRRLGIVFTDSMIVPLRAGVLGIAIAYSGFRGVRDYRGKRDIFGRRLRLSMSNVADSLATAAALLMGEGAECQPLALIEDAPVSFTGRHREGEMRFEPKDDLFRPFFEALQPELTLGETDDQRLVSKSSEGGRSPAAFAAPSATP